MSQTGCHSKGIDKLFAFLQETCVIDPRLDGFVHKSSSQQSQIPDRRNQAQNFPGVGVVLCDTDLFAVYYHGMVLGVLKEHADNGVCGTKVQADPLTT